MDQTYVNKLLAERATVLSQQREVLDRAAERGELPSAEENEAHARYDAKYDELTHTINAWTEAAKREAEADTARAAVESIVRPEVDQARSQEQMSKLERYFRYGDSTGLQTAAEEGRNGIEVDLKPSIRMAQMVRQGMDPQEIRGVFTDGGASGGSLVVPTTFLNQLYQYIEASSAIRRISYVFTTNSGQPMTLPKVATHGVGTQVVAQGTAIGGTDPIFGTMRLSAYKYGELVRVSTEAVADTGFDLLGFVAQNVGRAVGRITDTAYVTGNGTTAPNGIVTAASTGATTGGSLIAVGGGAATTFTQSVDCLINLQHSVVDVYRNSPSAAFVMNDLTAGTIRRLRDGGAGTIGSYIWTPATTFAGLAKLGQPDGLLNAPVYTDTNFGTQGSAVKTVAFGDWSTYYIRDSGGFRFERSDDRYFDTDEIAFRGLLRTDGNLIDTGAIKLLAQTP